MANVVNPNGFSVLTSRVGGANTGQDNWYYIPQTDTSQYGIGDMVKVAAGGDANGVPAVQKAIGGSNTEWLRGVIVGVAPTPNIGTPSLIGTPLALEITNIPATKTQGYYVLVNDDPNTVYEIQDDGLAVLTAAACNKNAQFTVVNPTAPLQNSATVMQTSAAGGGAAPAVTATFPLKILGLVLRQNPAGGNGFGAYARWMVKINTHDLSASGVVGV